ncbi:MAG TPA: hypothetical protein VGF37_03075 [Chthoniobacterales bacterium]|jgi:hypothetical protein
MKSINFASIFRRKDDPRPTDSKEQAGRRNLLERFAQRQVTLKEGEVTPLAKETPSLDWTTVNGRVTVLASAIEGLLEGRTRIKAQQLKNLDPCPIDRETEDSIEYAVSLAAIVSQIDDLLSDDQPETEQPEFETPFTVLAREDNARFEHRDKTQSREPDDDAAVGNGESLTNGGEAPRPIATKNPEPETHLERPTLSLRELRSPSRKPALGQPEITTPESQPPKANVDQAQSPESSKEVSIAVTQAEPTMVEPEVRQTAIPETGPKMQPTARRVRELQLPQLTEELAHQGVERLREIFMTSRPLDGRRVASLVQELPGINGALILLEGGVVLGGQLPESLNVEAALQAPEILKNFIRFIREVEAGQRAQSEFVSVTAATTISLAASGEIVLLVSHQAKTLPPGVAKRLTETAEALNLIYGNHHHHLSGVTSRDLV